MFRFESWDSDRTSSSEQSNTSWESMASADMSSVFGDDIKEKSGALRFSAQQLAVSSATNHFPTFNVGTNSGKCAMMHWACHVGWCLCKYQYQPMTPLHLLPNTPITEHCDVQRNQSSKRMIVNIPTTHLRKNSKTENLLRSASTNSNDADRHLLNDSLDQLYPTSEDHLPKLDILSMETTV